jgi:nitrogen-specific signal transduction histidine kinase
VRLSIRAKQVAGVTALVALAVVVLSGWYLASLARVMLLESERRAQLLIEAVFHRAFPVLAQGGDPYEALASDEGLKSILEASVFSAGTTYATIVNTDGVVIAHQDPQLVGQTLPRATLLSDLLQRGPIQQLRAIYTPGGMTLEVEQRLLLTDESLTNSREIGTIRVGVSTLLIQEDFANQLATPLLTALGAIAAAIVVSMLLAQLVLRPIHVIRSGLARLGRGELDVSVDLPHDSELDALGDSFKQISARLAAERTDDAEQRATLESVIDRLEDAVALVSPDGLLLFANPVMAAVLGSETGRLGDLLPADHPYRRTVERALAGDPAAGPLSVEVPGIGARLLVTHAVEGHDRQPLGVMLVARNLAYLSEVESSLSYSRKLAALSRLTAGIAHEIKNPLNATIIHLELLKMQLADSPDALEHVSVITKQVRRLDEVVQGLLKFTRPEDLRLQPVALAPLFAQMMPIIAAEASKSQVDVRLEVPEDLPPAQADPGLIEHAFLNLALNACQAMPNGGRLRIAARTRPGRQLEIAFEDTGLGIPPEHLSRIFDLYFTTKPQGSGIGLSLVYRTIQLHDGDIEVQSVPGRGTTFTVHLRQATEVAPPALATAAS